MSKITVTRRGYIIAVYYNRDAEAGEYIARLTHGSRCRYRVESMGDDQ